MNQQHEKVIFSDIDLARRLESVDAIGGAEYAATHARLFPQSDAASMPVAGGYATYAGRESPVTQAFALGLNGEVAKDEMDALEEFYRKQGAPVNIEVCPLAHPSLFEHLSARGYKPIEHSNVLVRALPFATLDAENRHAAVSVRLARRDEAQVWAETVMRGFLEPEEAPPMMIDMGKTAFHVPATHCFVAEQDGVIIGGGSMGVRHQVATLSGASTLTAYRKRGAQQALLYHRLKYATTEHACDLAMVATLPGSASQRNVERHGFHVAYTRTKWLRTWA
ncbi:MAG: GNAT family N-acetyltransferase [Pyrinomonadaceae bacterium]